jgi:hypothetical protein
MRYTVVALIAASAIPLAACGSSSTPSSSPSSTSGSSTTSATTSTSAPTSTSTPNAAGGGHDHVAGQVASVTGNKVSVTERNGSTTVDFSDSTKIAQIDTAGLTDVTAGSCVTVRPTRDSAQTGQITAQRIMVSPANNGQCGGPQGGQNGPVGQNGPGQNGPGQNGPGGPNGPGGQPGGGGHGGPGVRGTVASVNGNTIQVTSAGNQVNVAITPDTIYTKRSDSSVSAIAQGKCIAARGTTDGSGALQATSITLRQADQNGNCGGGFRH